MRYTAKARMLSFNFLIDPIVYNMTSTGAMLFAGMVARADNLGRMPGDPTVLLAYLFSPMPPRPDVFPEDVSGLLSNLSSCDPPILVWYEAGGAKYVEFTHWTKHQPGLREHNKKSSFPGPDSATQFFKPQSASAPRLDLDIMEPKPFSMDPARASAIGKAMAAKRQREVDSEYDPDLVELAVARLEPDPTKRAPWYKLALWLWKDGVTYMPNVIDLLEANARFKPENPFAYFASGGKGRDGISMRSNADRTVKDHEDIKRQEVEWAAKHKA